MIAPDRLTEVKRVVEHLYARGPDWVTFYREILGLRGVVRHAFPTREGLAAFEQTEAYQEILQLLTKLRAARPPGRGREGVHPRNHGAAAQELARSALRKKPMNTALA